MPLNDQIWNEKHFLNNRLRRNNIQVLLLAPVYLQYFNKNFIADDVETDSSTHELENVYLTALIKTGHRCNQGHSNI